jgi:hypothetical protein
MKEKRKIQRLELRTPARIEGVRKSGKKISLQAETKDISSHGAFFITKHGIEEKVTLDIELVLSMKKFQQLLGRKGQVRIQLQGTVVRNEPEGIAVSFSRKYKMTVLNHDRAD